MSVSVPPPEAAGAAGAVPRKFGGPRRVVITNVFADDNRGGAAITEATMRFAREVVRDASLRLLAVSGDASRLESSHRHSRHNLSPGDELVPAPFTPSGRLGGVRAVVSSILFLVRRATPSSPLALKEVRGATLVISKGGHVFVAARRGLRSLFGLWLTAYPLVYASRWGVPSIVYGASIGPFAGRLDTALNAYILRRATLVMPRDLLSRQRLVSLGVSQSSILQMPDSVFALKPPTLQERRATLERLGLPAGRYLTATARMRSSADADRLDVLAASISQAAARTAGVDSVVLVLQVDGPSVSDAGATAKLRAHLAERGVHVQVVEDDLDHRELAAVYGGGRATIACRMHSAILSVIAGTPSTVLEMDGTKAAGVFASLGVPEAVFPFDRFDPAALAEAVVRFADDPGGEVRQRFAAGVAALHDAHQDLADEAVRRLWPPSGTVAWNQGIGHATATTSGWAPNVLSSKCAGSMKLWIRRWRRRS
jgi:polysaccharide pyruvyl transferase WcaK-like protein